MDRDFLHLLSAVGYWSLAFKYKTPSRIDRIRDDQSCRNFWVGRQMEMVQSLKLLIQHFIWFPTKITSAFPTKFSLFPDIAHQLPLEITMQHINIEWNLDVDRGSSSPLKLPLRRGVFTHSRAVGAGVTNTWQWNLTTAEILVMEVRSFRCSGSAFNKNPHPRPELDQLGIG